MLLVVSVDVVSVDVVSGDVVSVLTSVIAEVSLIIFWTVIADVGYIKLISVEYEAWLE